VKAFTYRIKLLEPVLVTSLEGDPNSASAFDYLPGSVLRGAIIGGYLGSQNLTSAQFKADDPETRRLFFDGTTRYLNGYLLEDNKRVLPVPHSWQHEKDEENEFFDFAVEPSTDDETQWQGIGAPFCLLLEAEDDDEEGEEMAQARLIQPDRLITVHTRRTRRFGRAMPEEIVRPGETPGAVYRYEALRAGQVFEAAIIFDHDADAARLLPLLDGEAKLGGSRSGSYGRVRFEHTNNAPSDWREVGGTLQLKPDGKLIITLLSDAQVRDPNGQYVVDSQAVTNALSATLGNVPLTLDPQRTFLRGTTIGGFNRKWGLPLLQTLAVRMGSVFVFDAPGGDAAALQAALCRLEQLGIGERRAEGFGRVAVNWHTRKRLKKDEPSISRLPPKTITPGSKSHTIAQQMATRMLRQRLDAALAEKANALGKQIKGPKNSQLSRLRLVIHDSLRQEPTEGRQRLNQYFQSLRDRQATRKQFTRTGDRVAGKGLLEWMENRVADQASIWSEIDIDPNKLPAIGANVTATLTVELVYEYNLRLIDSVLARAVKERKGDN
jgi:CRISPR-associated protein Csx10